jgi:hypothetical protein
MHKTDRPKIDIVNYNAYRDSTMLIPIEAKSEVIDRLKPNSKIDVLLGRGSD